MIAPTMRRNRFDDRFSSPEITGASIPWATMRARDRRRRSATPPTWSGCQWVSKIVCTSPMRRRAATTALATLSARPGNPVSTNTTPSSTTTAYAFTYPIGIDLTSSAPARARCHCRRMCPELVEGPSIRLAIALPARGVPAVQPRCRTARSSASSRHDQHEIREARNDQCPSADAVE